MGGVIRVVEGDTRYLAFSSNKGKDSKILHTSYIHQVHRFL